MLELLTINTNNMRLKYIIFFLLVPCISLAQITNSDDVFTFPVNDSIVKAYALTDKVVSQLLDFNVGTEDSLTSNETVWYWFFTKGNSPEIDFLAEKGLRSLSVFGPFSTDFKLAADSIKDGLSSPTYSNVYHDGEPIATKYTVPQLTEPGLYILQVSPLYKSTSMTITPEEELAPTMEYGKVEKPPVVCAECAEGELPRPGKYLAAAWVRTTDSPNLINYTGLSLQVRLNYSSTSTSYVVTAEPSSFIIDGWQLWESEFTVLPDLKSWDLFINCSTSECLIDDIRIQPLDASMKSFVYDPLSLRLLAQLDERHYSTIYEYDEEGKLKRIKKETERGIMTIQETNTSNQK